MFESRVIVFREIQLNDQVMFQHYRLGSESEDYIVEDFILPPDEHWEFLEQD